MVTTNELADARSTAKRLYAENDELRAQVERLRAERDGAVATATCVQRQHTAAQRRRDVLQGERDTAAGECDQLRARVAELEAVAGEYVRDSYRPSPKHDAVQSVAHIEAAALDRFNLKHAQRYDIDDEEIFLIRADDLWDESERLRGDA